jgi:hypothetical protein
MIVSMFVFIKYLRDITSYIIHIPYNFYEFVSCADYYNV